MKDPTQIQDTPDPPLVSVAITAYNSEKWLPRAIRSAIEQRTTFPFEIVVGDDCSRDASLNIGHSYRQQYPDFIRVLERKSNVGIQRNTYETLNQCHGKYIAWLDADDYWTDKDKLAIQVETLESNPSVSACCHYARWITNDGEVKREKYPSISPGQYGLEEVLRHDFLPSLSVMFRNGIQRDLPAWYFDLEALSDWPIWVLAALSGDIILLDRIMADYMLTPGSSMMSRGALFWHKMDAEFYKHVETILPSEWHRLVRNERGKRFESMAYLLRKEGNFVASRSAAFSAFRSPFFLDNLGSKTKSLLSAVASETEWRLRGRRPSA